MCHVMIVGFFVLIAAAAAAVAAVADDDDSVMHCECVCYMNIAMEHSLTVLTIHQLV